MLPLTLLGIAFRVVMGLIIDLLVAMFWGAALLTCRTWNLYRNIGWKILVVLLSPLLVIGGILAAPCLLRSLPDYRFCRQTKLEWYSGVEMLPREFRCCPP